MKVVVEVAVCVVAREVVLEEETDVLELEDREVDVDFVVEDDDGVCVVDVCVVEVCVLEDEVDVVNVDEVDSLEVLVEEAVEDDDVVSEEVDVDVWVLEVVDDVVFVLELEEDEVEDDDDVPLEDVDVVKVEDDVERVEVEDDVDVRVLVPVVVDVVVGYLRSTQTPRPPALNDTTGSAMGGRLLMSTVSPEHTTRLSWLRPHTMSLVVAICEYGAPLLSMPPKTSSKGMLLPQLDLPQHLMVRFSVTRAQRSCLPAATS